MLKWANLFGLLSVVGAAPAVTMPVVTSANPPHGTIVNSHDDLVFEVYFDQEMKAQTVEEQLKILDQTDGKELNYTTTWQAHMTQLIVWPTHGSLSPNHKYSVVLNSGGKSAKGFPMIKPFVSSVWVANGRHPSVTSIVPRERARHVPVDTDIRVMFSKPMNTSALKLTLESVSGEGEDEVYTNVPGHVQWEQDNTEALFLPSSRLASDTRFRIAFSGVKDIEATMQGGEEHETTFHFLHHFTTGDALAPAVSSVTPAAGHRAAPDSPIVVTFSQPVMESMVEKAFHLYLFNPDTNEPIDMDIKGRMSHSDDFTTFSFFPDAPLNPDSHYQVKVGSNVINRARGSPMNDQSLHAFKTGKNREPALLSMVPPGNSKNLHVNEPLIFTFNTAMDKASLNKGISVQCHDGTDLKDQVLEVSPDQRTVTWKVKRGVFLPADTKCEVKLEMLFSTAGLPMKQTKTLTVTTGQKVKLSLTCDCNGHGECVQGIGRHGACQCEKGWEGQNCDKKQDECTAKDLPCAHGGCVGGHCDCDENHYGVQCELDKFAKESTWTVQDEILKTQEQFNWSMHHAHLPKGQKHSHTHSEGDVSIWDDRTWSSVSNPAGGLDAEGHHVDGSDGSGEANKPAEEQPEVSESSTVVAPPVAPPSAGVSSVPSGSTKLFDEPERYFSYTTSVLGVALLINALLIGGGVLAQLAPTSRGLANMKHNAWRGWEMLDFVQMAVLVMGLQPGRTGALDDAGEHNAITASFGVLNMQLPPDMADALCDMVGITLTDDNRLFVTAAVAFTALLTSVVVLTPLVWAVLHAMKPVSPALRNFFPGRACVSLPLLMVQVVVRTLLVGMCGLVVASWNHVTTQLAADMTSVCAVATLVSLTMGMPYVLMFAGYFLRSSNPQQYKWEFSFGTIFQPFRKTIVRYWAVVYYVRRLLICTLWGALRPTSDGAVTALSVMAVLEGLYLAGFLFRRPSNTQRQFMGHASLAAAETALLALTATHSGTGSDICFYLRLGLLALAGMCSVFSSTLIMVAAACGFRGGKMEPHYQAAPTKDPGFQQDNYSGAFVDVGDSLPKDMDNWGGFDRVELRNQADEDHLDYEGVDDSDLSDLTGDDHMGTDDDSYFSEEEHLVDDDLEDVGSPVMDDDHLGSRNGPVVPDM